MNGILIVKIIALGPFMHVGTSMDLQLPSLLLGSTQLIIGYVCGLSTWIGLVPNPFIPPHVRLIKRMHCKCLYMAGICRFHEIDARVACLLLYVDSTLPFPFFTFLSKKKKKIMVK